MTYLEFCQEYHYNSHNPFAAQRYAEWLVYEQEDNEEEENGRRRVRPLVR